MWNCPGCPSDLLAITRLLGITRLANVTGLDRLQIPVWTAVRPAARSLSITFGKALTDRDAILTAVMEAAELHAAENLVTCDLHEQGQAKLMFDGQKLVTNADAAAPCGLMGYRHRDRADIFIPGNLVSMDKRWSSVKDGSVNTLSTTGLAGHFTADRAILHGLLEVIERNAHACWNRQTDEARAMTLIDVASIHSPDVQSLLKVFERQNLLVMVWNITNKIGVPCILAEAIDRTGAASSRPYSQGVACRLDPVAAIISALLECAQVRLTYIAGTREDLDDSDFGDHFNDVSLSRLNYAANNPTQQAFDLIFTNQSQAQDGGDFAVVLEKLSACGLDDVISVHVPVADGLLSVVKTFVVGLDEEFEDDDIALPPRAVQASPR